MLILIVLVGTIVAALAVTVDVVLAFTTVAGFTVTASWAPHGTGITTFADNDFVVFACLAIAVFPGTAILALVVM